MFTSRRGSVYRIVLAVLIGIAFCFALAWPKYSKYRNAKHLNQAADLGRALAFAQETYKQQHGAYTPKFQMLDIPLSCPMVSTGRGLYLDCPEYTYQLEDENMIRISHKHLPLWLEVDIPQGSIVCRYADDDWAGQDLCARMQ